MHESSPSMFVFLDEVDSFDSYRTASDIEHSSTDDSSHQFVPPLLEESSDLFKPLYSGSSVTVCGAICSIMQYCIAYKLSYSAIGELLKLLQLLCPTPNHLPSSVFLLKKFFNSFKMKYNDNNLCSNCDAKREHCHCDHPAYDCHLIHIPLQKPLFAVLKSK